MLRRELISGTLFHSTLHYIPCVLPLRLILSLLLFQAVYRVIVDILNENDNFPEFTEDTVHSLNLSEVSLS